MHRLFPLTLAIAAAVAALTLAAPAGAATASCAELTVGPGSLVRGQSGGAACLLAAFEKGCRPAEYRLAAYGVDTSVVHVFRTARRNGRCTLVVTTTLRVFPRPPGPARPAGAPRSAGGAATSSPPPAGEGR